VWSLLESTVAAVEGRPTASLPGIITASAAVFTALALVITAITGLIRSLRVESKVDGVGQRVDTVQSTITDQRAASAVYVESLLAAIGQLQMELVALREAERARVAAAESGRDDGR
jgi:hypothetical protein